MRKLKVFQLADYQVVTHTIHKALIFSELKYSYEIRWHSSKKKLTLHKVSFDYEKNSKI